MVLSVYGMVHHVFLKLVIYQLDKQQMNNVNNGIKFVIMIYLLPNVKLKIYLILVVWQLHLLIKIIKNVMLGIILVLLIQMEQ